MNYNYSNPNFCYQFIAPMFTLNFVFPDASHFHNFYTCNGTIHMECITLYPDGSRTAPVVFTEDSEDYRAFFETPFGHKARKIMSDYRAGKLQSSTYTFDVVPM